QGGLDPRPDGRVRLEESLLGPPEIDQRVPVVEQHGPDGHAPKTNAPPGALSAASPDWRGRTGWATLLDVRVRVISDVHGATSHLATAGRDADVLVVLGDLINVIDYRSMDGILVDVFGREPVAEAATLRAKGRFSEARAALRRRTGDEREARERFVELARAQYQLVFDALPEGTVVTYGNVD